MERNPVGKLEGDPVGVADVVVGSKQTVTHSFTPNSGKKSKEHDS